LKLLKDLGKKDLEKRFKTAAFFLVGRMVWEQNAGIKNPEYKNVLSISTVKEQLKERSLYFHCVFVRRITNCGTLPSFWENSNNISFFFPIEALKHDWLLLN
jgi:hypothetical protein